MPKYIPGLSAAAVLGALSAPAGAQGVIIPDTVNQIEGTVLFNQGPLPHTLERLDVYTSTVTLPIPRGAYTTAPFSANAAAYSVTVLADDLTHNVTPLVYLDGFQDYYYFANAVSDPVPDEPAAAVNLDFTECAGFVSYEFIDLDTGNPFTVVNSGANASPEVSPGSFAGAQAGTGMGATSGGSFAVRGDGSNYRIDIGYRIGVLSFSHSEDRVVNCDEAAAPIQIFVDSDLPFELGSIIGHVDLRYVTELPDTYMVADSGPSGNSGFDVISATPAIGPFSIENLVPSTIVSPDDPYRVYAQLQIDDALGLETFYSPTIEVVVPEGGVADTSNSFIMGAGFMEGDIDIEGPADCINAMNAQSRWLFGSSSGAAIQSPSSSTDVHTDATMLWRRSDYHMAVGAPNDAVTFWSPRLDTSSTHADMSGPTGSSSYSFSDNLVGSPQINPTDVVEVDVQHCLSLVLAEVDVNHGVSGASVFNNPRVGYGGSYISPDGTVNYNVNGGGNGKPFSNEARASRGTVPMCIPQGFYTFDATVSAADELGAISETQLEHVQHEIPCGAIINPDIVTVDVDPGCQGDESMPFSINIESFFGEVDVVQAYYVINGGPQVEICNGNCNTVPTLDVDIPTAGLLQCGNEIRVSVVDDQGRVSVSGIEPFTFEAAGPSGGGCGSPSLSVGESLDWDDVLGPLNSCDLDATSVRCAVAGQIHNPPTVGPTLAVGTHRGNCRMVTECGTRTCSFNVTVGN